MHTRELFLKHQGQTSDFPLLLEVAHANGCYFYDPSGKEYLDLISGIAVSNVGHCHPSVVQALHEQIDKHLHVMVYGELVQESPALLAKALAGTLPPSLSQVFFVNSGSEAVEGALKLARRYTGRTNFLSLNNAYHGATMGALSLCGNEPFKNAFRPLLPGMGLLTPNNFDEIERITKDTAAVFIEPIQGEAGVRVLSKEWVKAVKDQCNAKGALLIFDEIQSGYGRTGTFWAFEQLGVIPDVLLTAKGMGGGMPLGAFISSEEILSCLKTNPILGHITTFGGHPLSCAASLAALTLINNQDVLEGVKRKAELVKSNLTHTGCVEVRGCGLMLAAELSDPSILIPMIHRLLEKGVLTDWFLFCDSAIRIAPPLEIPEEALLMGIHKIKETFDELNA